MAGPAAICLWVNSLVSPHLFTILGGNILNYIKTVFWHDANAPTLSCITYIFMEGKKTTVHRLIHHTTTESGLVVSISYRPHFKQIASSLHTPSLTQRILLVRRRPVARIYGSYSMSFNSSNVGEFFTSSRKQWRKRYTELNSVMHVQGYLFLFLFQPSLFSSRYLNFLVLVSMYLMKRIYLWKMRGYSSFLSRFQWCYIVIILEKMTSH